MRPQEVLNGLDSFKLVTWRGAGYDPREPYVETFWIPVVGPSTYLMARLFADWLEDHRTVQVPIDLLGMLLGLGGGNGRNSPVVRTIARMADFRLADVGPAAVVKARTRWPALEAHQLVRLPQVLRKLHDQGLTSTSGLVH